MPIDTAQETDMVQETDTVRNERPSARSKYLFKPIEESLDRVKQFWGVYLAALDQLLATPLANANVTEDYFWGRKLFSAINNSPYATLLHVALFGIGILVLIIGHIVAVYRTMRIAEKKSHFFYFRRLLQSEQSDTVKGPMGQGKFENDILSAAAHFYSPDISEQVCRKRRFFAWLMGNKEYVKLKKYLADTGLRDKRTEKEILKDLHLETIDKLVKYLNKKTTPPNKETTPSNLNSSETNSNLPVKFQRKGDTYSIGFSEKYSKIYFSKDIVLPEKPKKNVSLVQSILGAIEEACSLYWIGMFVFYFAPTIGVIAGVSFPPLALAICFLTLRCVYLTYSFKKASVSQQICSLNDKEINALEVARLKESDESDYVELKKQQVFIKGKVAHIKLTLFKGSKLHKDLRKVLSYRRFMKMTAILNGFLSGCFLPFCGVWLFNDTFKVVAGLAIGGTITGPLAPAVFSIIFMVIAGVILLLGVGYGVKKAIKAAKDQDEKYEKLEKKVEEVEYWLDDKLSVLDLPLFYYDRLLRRYSLEKPTWTMLKRILSRLWIVGNRFGTGSLVFRLIILGTITSLTAFMTVPIVTLIAPSILAVLTVGFGLLFAAWYYYDYGIGKEWKQAENIINHFSLSRMAAEQEIEHQHLLEEENRLTTGVSGSESPGSGIMATLLEVVHSSGSEEGMECSKLALLDSQVGRLGYPLIKAKSEDSLTCDEFQDDENSLASSQYLSSSGTTVHYRAR